MPAAALTALAMLAAGAPAASEPHRFALAIGSNAGDLADEPLRFAEEDARAFLQTLKDVGGVRPGDAIALLGASTIALDAALAQLRARMAEAPGDNDQLFVYVSSHADEGELHLAGSRYPFRKLSDFIKQAPASVAVLIVDSCRSGALTRLKGLVPLPGFTVNVEVPDVRGRVVITSSGADEYAQESDRYRGSYFTHHLLAALRGAADDAKDGRITLQEAYAYAYRRTVETTFATRGGAQHPSYAVDLKGQGDLVLADLNHVDGRLVLDVDDPGQWIVVRAGDGAMVAEFEKPRGRAAFAVAPGSYRVSMRDGASTREATVDIPLGGEASVSDARLGRAPLLSSRAKGGGARTLLAVGGLVGNAAANGFPPLPGVELLVRHYWAGGVVDSWTASAAFGLGAASAPAALSEGELTLQGGAGHHWDTGLVSARLGLEAGATLVAQRGGALPSTSGSTAPFAGLRAEGALQLAGPVAALLSLFAGPDLLQQPSGLSVGAKLEAVLGLAVSL